MVEKTISLARSFRHNALNICLLHRLARLYEQSTKEEDIDNSRRIAEECRCLMLKLDCQSLNDASPNKKR